MIRWSIRSIGSEGTVLLASCTGVAFAFLLVMFFEAVFNGESERITAYPTQVNADVWVMQKGVANMHMAVSQLWDWKEDRIRSIEGVADTESILYMNAVIDAGDREWFAYIVGLGERADFPPPGRCIAANACRKGERWLSRKPWHASPVSKQVTILP